MKKNAEEKERNRKLYNSTEEVLDQEDDKYGEIFERRSSHKNVDNFGRIRVNQVLSSSKGSKFSWTTQNK